MSGYRAVMRSAATPPQVSVQHHCTHKGVNIATVNHLLAERKQLFDSFLKLIDVGWIATRWAGNGRSKFKRTTNFTQISSSS